MSPIARGQQVRLRLGRFLVRAVLRLCNSVPGHHILDAFKPKEFVGVGVHRRVKFCLSSAAPAVQLEQ
jgi:hypothetical protein